MVRVLVRVLVEALAIFSSVGSGSRYTFDDVAVRYSGGGKARREGKKRRGTYIEEREEKKRR